MAGFTDLGNQFRALYSSFTIGQKVSIVIMIILLAVVFGLLSLWAGRPEYHVLYTKLSVEDAQSVISDIEGKIKYELRDGGTTILVPQESLYKLRLDLASKGLPKGGVVGFEIFDKSAFGVTDFAQRVNYKRAIEGELTRTIMQLDSVSSAKVIIAIPEKSLFTEDKEVPSSSVVLGLQRPGALSKSQVQGIVYLVSSSVEGLLPSNITVIDTKGNILYKGSSDSEAELASTQYEFKKQYESNLEKKIISMLEKVVGVNKSVAMVSAEFDFAAVNKTEEIFDPEGTVVISEQRSSDTSSNQSATPAGTPGVRTNIPTTETAAGGRAAASTGKKTSETINYEVSKTVKSTKEAVGELTKLSISLMVDGVYRKATKEEAATAVPGTEGLIYSPRSEDELEQIRALTMSAVGFDEERGDQIEVESMPFQKAQVEVVQAGMAPPEEGEGIWPRMGKYAFSVVIMLLVILFVVLPLTKWMTQVPKMPVSPEGLPVSVGAGIITEAPRVRGPIKTAEEIEDEREAEVRALEAEIAGESKVPEGAKRKQAIKSRLSRMTDKDPDSVAQLLKTWMHED
jgi:flagellar M-ring protein FliF